MPFLAVYPSVMSLKISHWLVPVVKLSREGNVFCFQEKASLDMYRRGAVHRHSPTRIMMDSQETVFDTETIDDTLQCIYLSISHGMQCDIVCGCLDVNNNSSTLRID
ncbi:unnamed protein product, partial [Sphacelaria rigidula]